jgi:hypothetical protein
MNEVTLERTRQVLRGLQARGATVMRPALDPAVTTLGTDLERERLLVLVSGQPSGGLTVTATDGTGRPWTRTATGTLAPNAALRTAWARAHLLHLEDDLDAASAIARASRGTSSIPRCASTSCLGSRPT